MDKYVVEGKEISIEKDIELLNEEIDEYIENKLPNLTLEELMQDAEITELSIREILQTIKINEKNISFSEEQFEKISKKIFPNIEAVIKKYNENMPSEISWPIILILLTSISYGQETCLNVLKTISMSSLFIPLEIARHKTSKKYLSKKLNRLDDIQKMYQISIFSKEYLEKYYECHLRKLQIINNRINELLENKKIRKL